MLIHQLAREVWWYESPFPMSLLGYAAEPVYLRAYRKSPVFTVSQSTQTDLRNLGFSGPITIVPEGLEQITPAAYERASTPTFLYVGRMSRSKRVNEVIRAFAMFVASTGTGQLWLIGDGAKSLVGRLANQAEHLGVTGRVRFFGKLSRNEKHRYMAEANAVVLASVREGWGLAVAEASAFGTPAIVYRVPGLRDAVEPEVTGLVVEPSPEAMAEGMKRIAYDPVLYECLSKQARARSSQFSFDLSADTIRKTMMSAIQ
jgi:glycosyltransferase involved in cell wall biosynthesis